MNAEAAPQAAARKRKSRWAVVAVVVLVVIVAAAAAFALLRPKAGAQASVSTAQVTRQTLRILVSGTGTTVVADSVTVNPKISGTVKKLYVSLGKSVSAGDRLYTITSDDVETQRLQAKASLLQSKQSLAQAKQNRTQASNQVYAAKTQQLQAQQNLDNLRSQPATTPGIDDQIAVAKRQLTSAKKGVTSANQSVTSAEAGVDAAEANYTSSQQSYNDAVDATHDTVVTAPIDGVVTVLPISVGSDVNAGSTSSSSGSSGGAVIGQRRLIEWLDLVIEQRQLGLLDNHLRHGHPRCRGGGQRSRHQLGQRRPVRDDHVRRHQGHHVRGQGEVHLAQRHEHLGRRQLHSHALVRTAGRTTASRT